MAWPYAARQRGESGFVSQYRVLTTSGELAPSVESDHGEDRALESSPPIGSRLAAPGLLAVMATPATPGP